MTYTNVINLIVAPVALTLIYVYALAKIIRNEKTADRRSIQSLIMTGFYLAAMVIIFTVPLLNAKDILQLVLTVGLVVATVSYAISANKQADTSMEMAEEMREQRYDALRPIIDIVEQPTKGTEKEKQGFDAREGKFPKDLLCKLRNIGVGPAIEVFSFIEGAEDKPRRWDFGTIPVAIGEEGMGYTETMRLFLEQRGNHRALVACYKDVYGNLFESSREVSVDRDKEAVNIGALKVSPLPKKENKP